MKIRYCFAIFVCLLSFVICSLQAKRRTPALAAVDPVTMLYGKVGGYERKLLIDNLQLSFGCRAPIILSGDLSKHVIGPRGNGFFSEFFSVIQNIEWAIQAGKTPVVYWDYKCLYSEPEEFNGTHNAWEYYFEPISDAQCEPDDELYREYFTPSGFGIPFLDFSGIEELRPRMHAIIKKYIKLKPYILDTVSDFYFEHMVDCSVIGIHLRGTDKGSEAVPIHPIVVINKAQEYAHLAKKMFPGKPVKFLVASDEQRLIEFAKKNLHGTVITFDDATRSSTGKPIHAHSKKAKVAHGCFAALGRDVLVETLLLSCCDFFAHTRSNVSTAVILFNSKLTHFQCDGYAKL